MFESPIDIYIYTHFLLFNLKKLFLLWAKTGPNYKKLDNYFKKSIKVNWIYLKN